MQVFFEERACKSLTLHDEVTVIKKTVFIVSETVSNVSNGLVVSLSETKSKLQTADKGLTGCLK